MKTILTYIILVLTIILFPRMSSAYITVSGDVSGQTWVNTQTYYVESGISVSNGSTLEIQEGTVIKFAPNTYLFVYGTLIADGTAQQNIIFTSKDDNSAGEIISGSSGLPVPGSWYYIQVNGSGAYIGDARFDHCVVRYGGQNYSGELCNVYFYGTEYGYFKNSTIEHSSTGGLRLYSCSNIVCDNNTIISNGSYGAQYYYSPVNVTNCIISGNGGEGIYLTGSGALIDNCIIENNQSHGIISSSASYNITNCQISNNAGWAAKIDNSTIRNYNGNGGTGNGYDAFSLYGSIEEDLILGESTIGFPIVVTGNLSVGNGFTLTLSPGEIIKLDYGNLQVFGSLIADGTMENPIVFTSFKDDTYGGDLNGDGNISAPAKGDWYTVNLNGSASYDGVGRFDNCIFRYGGSNYTGELSTVYYYGSTTGYFKNSKVEQSYYGGVKIYSCENIDFVNNTLQNNGSFGTEVYYSAIDIQNFTVTGNASYGIYVNGSGALIDNCNISNNGSHGIYSSVASYEITNCVINNNGGWAGKIDNSTIKEYSGITGSGNGFDAFSMYGSVNQDLVLSESIIGFPVVINGNLLISTGNSLTFPAGEIVKLDYGNLQVQGSLVANGTMENPIVFTSFKDDTYGGDLNGDGNISAPAKGDWYTVILNGSGAYDGVGRFDNCIFRYGGSNYTGELSTVYYYGSTTGYFKNSKVEQSYYGGVKIYSCENIEFENNTLQNNGSFGTEVYYSAIDIQNFTVTGNASYGIYVNGSGALIDNCNISNNGSHGIYSSVASYEITNCVINNNGGWAGKIDNSTIKEYSGITGSGNGFDAFSINGSVNQDLVLSESIIGFPVVINGNLLISNGNSLTFPAGEIIKLDYGNLQVQGSLVANGTMENPIVFTSFKDDSYGGDLNGDGLVSLPAKGDWYSIAMNGSGALDGVGQLDHCIIKYGGSNYTGELASVYFYATTAGFLKNSTIAFGLNSGVVVNSATDLVIFNNTITNHDTYGIYVYYSTLDVEECQVYANGSYGVYFSGGSSNIKNCEISSNGSWAAWLDNVDIHDYPGNSGNGNGYDAFRIVGSVNHDLTLTRAGIGFPFVFGGLVTVNTGYELTLPPGEVVKLISGHIQVYGSLNANGMAENPIVFTSFKDDTYGGDLNGDGTVSSPAKGDWYTVSINGSGTYDGEGWFDHCLFRYGGQNYSGELSQVYYYGNSNGYFKNSTIEYSYYSGLVIYSASGMEVFNNTIKDCQSYGIHVTSCSVDFNNLNIFNNGLHGIYLYASGSNFSNCQINNNGGWAAWLDNVSVKNYSDNTGTGNGFDVFRLVGTVEQDITLAAAESGFPYMINGILTVNDGVTLTIPEAEIVKLDFAAIFVYGSLIADGSYINPVVFTSFKDDEYGGDWNNDGTISSPAPGDWYMINLFGSGAYDGVGEFDHCLIRYGGQNYSGEMSSVYFYANTNGFIRHSTIEKSLNNGLGIASSVVQVRSNIFKDNISYGIHVSGSPLPDLGGNIASNGGFNRFINNDSGEFQLYYYGTVALLAEYNDWGYYDQAEIDQHIYDDNETGALGYVIYEPFFNPSDEIWQFEPDFEVDFTKIHVGGLLHFTDLTSSNPATTHWEWDFQSDGSVETELKNPTFHYDTEGIYSVTMVVSNGAFETAVTKENYINVGNYGAAEFTYINDVPNDQGGWVYAGFTRSEFDTNSLVKSTAYYSVQINDGNGWFSAGYSSAYGADSYTVMCHTPFDSSAYSLGLLDFRVIAAMEEGTYVSEVVTGYSVDNLKPSVPTGIDVVLGDTLITLTWNPCPDADFDFFAIYRSEQSGVFSEIPYGYTIETTFTDTIAISEYFYYKITAVDFAGNESDGSGIVATTKEMEILIPQGWSGLSTWLNPMDQDVEHMFDPILQKLVILQNQTGMFWPGENVNTLENWNILDGYAIKLSSQAELTIPSTREVYRNVELPEGWAIIPVLSNNSVNVTELFLEADIKIVKDIAGNGVYWPEFNINSLVTVDPGKAYYVKSNTPSTIIYPLLSKKSASTTEKTTHFVNATPWNDVIYTNGSHLVAFVGEALSLLEEGDVVGAFTLDGLCAGMAEYQDDAFVVTLNMNDYMTDFNEGFENNDAIYYRLFRPAANKVFELDVVSNSAYEIAEKFCTNGLSVVSRFKFVDGDDENNEHSISIYPNPTSGKFTLIGLDLPTNIEIATNDGAVVFRNRVNAGESIDLSDLPRGMYLIKVNHQMGTTIKKLVLN